MWTQTIQGEIQGNVLLLGDCINLLSGVSDKSVDLIIADPPFGINFESEKSNYNRDSSYVLDGYSDIKPQHYGLFTNNWMFKCNQVLKDNGSMYIFSGWNRLFDILNVINSLNLTVVNHLIWKYNFGVYCSKKYVSSHYHILYVCKNPDLRRFYRRFPNDTTASYHDLEDVWEIPREYWKGEDRTPNKLPFDLCKKIIEYSSIPDDIVLDPFAGSGTVLKAAQALKRQFIGMEIVPAYFEFARKYLSLSQIGSDVSVEFMNTFIVQRDKLESETLGGLIPLISNSCILGNEQRNVPEI